jgi:hypothetical protein
MLKYVQKRIFQTLEWRWFVSLIGSPYCYGKQWKMFVLVTWTILKLKPSNMISLPISQYLSCTNIVKDNLRAVSRSCRVRLGHWSLSHLRIIFLKIRHVDPIVHVLYLIKDSNETRYLLLYSWQKTLRQTDYDIRSATYGTSYGNFLLFSLAPATRSKTCLAVTRLPQAFILKNSQ